MTPETDSQVVWEMQEKSLDEAFTFEGLYLSKTIDFTDWGEDYITLPVYVSFDGGKKPITVIKEKKWWQWKGKGKIKASRFFGRRYLTKVVYRQVPYICWVVMPLSEAAWAIKTDKKNRGQMINRLRLLKGEGVMEVTPIENR